MSFLLSNLAGERVEYLPCCSCPVPCFIVVCVPGPGTFAVLLLVGWHHRVASKSHTLHRIGRSPCSQNAQNATQAPMQIKPPKAKCSPLFPNCLSHRLASLTSSLSQLFVSQVGFFDIVALPLFQSFAQAFQEATPVLETVKNNYHVSNRERCFLEHTA